MKSPVPCDRGFLLIQGMIAPINPKAGETGIFPVNYPVKAAFWAEPLQMLFSRV